MELLYLSHLDKYLTSDGSLYTEEQLDVIDEEERQWKASLPKYTFQQLLQIFPESTKAARRGVKNEIKYYKNLQTKANEEQQMHYDTIISKAHFTEQVELQSLSDVHYEDLHKQIESKIKTRVWRLAHIDELEGKSAPKNNNGVSEGDIATAKAVPLEEVFDGEIKKFGRRATANCPFHTEKTGSFTIYRDQNSYYCYGCHVGGSVVDFVMAQQDITFLEAVKRLIK